MRILFKLLILFTLLYSVNGYDYTSDYNNVTNKLIFTSIGSQTTNYLSRIDCMDETGKVTSSIKFTCETNSGKVVCSSDKLDPKNLIAYKIGFYAKGTNGDVAKNDGVFPIPYPNVVSFEYPPTAGGSVLIAGDLLRFAQGDPLSVPVLINGKSVKVPLEQKSGFDASSFKVVFPAGSGKIVLKFNGKYFNYYYKSPTITNISGAPGNYIIEGTNFYTSTANVEVQSDGKKIGTIKSVTDTKITLEYTPQYSETHSISLSINTLVTSQSYPWKLVPIPESVDSSVIIAKSTGGDLIITGKRLSAPPSTSSSSSSSSTEQIKTLVKVGEQDCIFKSSTSDSITCSLPKALDKQYSDLKIVVTIGDLASTNEAKFSYDIKPTLKTVQQNQYNFTAYGYNLGLSGTIITITSKDGSSKDISDGILYSDENSLSFKLPTDISLCDITIKTADGISSPVEVRATPVINDNILGFPPTKGGKLILSGAYLDPASVDGILVSIVNDNSNAQISCDNIEINQVDGSLSCNLQSGTGNKLTASIKIGNNNYTVDFSYQAPSDIKVLSQKGNVIEIEGNNLGNNASLLCLKVGDRIITASSVNDDTKATFTLPSDITSNKNTVVVVDNVQSESSIDFKIRPTCKSIENSNTEGQDIYISGSFFDESSSFKIGLGGANLIDANVVNATTLKLVAPKGSGINKKVVIQYNGEPLDDGNQLLFNYNAPTIISATSITDSKGGEITVYGTNFAETNASVTVDKKECKNLTIINSISLKCTLPQQGKNETAPVKGKKYPIYISIDGQSVSEDKFEYNNEAINTVPPELTKPPVTKPPVVPTKKAEPTEIPSEIPDNNSNIIYHSSILIISIIILNLII